MTTLQSILSDYESNADYRETSSVTKALAFISACTKLLVKLPARSSGGGSEVEIDTALVEKQLDRAEQWVQANRSSSDELTDPSVIHPHFNDFRY